MCWGQRSTTTQCSAQLHWLEKRASWKVCHCAGNAYTSIITSIFFKKIGNLDLGWSKRKFWFILQTGCGCLFEWGILLFLKNCMICCCLLCYGLRQPFLTLSEAAVFSFSPSDLKMVPGRSCRGKLTNCMQRSVSVQLTLHKCDADVSNHIYIPQMCVG